MNKELIVSRLSNTIERLEGLPHLSFNFMHFVTKFDREKGCPTIADVAGWYPKWFPECGLEWEVDYTGLARLVNKEYPDRYLNGKIASALSHWHGLSELVIYSLFMGNIFYLPDTTYIRVEGGLQAQLSDVIKHFKHVKDLITSNTFPLVIWTRDDV